ncbi:MAG: ATP-sensitive inward rectifier potassium channel 10 [Clostridia bacterium]|nr:ATP-sensitive inward rectifier potassium channel 10 [Deltaproteobacteria bacterium]
MTSGVTTVRLVGATPHTLRDLYQLLLQLSWASLLTLLIAVYVLANCVFAIGFLITSGVANARPGSFADAFFFSVQTLGTIGYGRMEPETAAANLLVLAESVVGVLMTAVFTGLTFARFSRSSGRLVFSSTAVICPMNGIPTLMFRVGNDSSSTVVDAVIRVAVVRTERTLEGTTFYRMTDLRLSRDRSPTLNRSWLVLHPIEPDSPLYGGTPERFAKDEIELVASVIGTDDTSMQQVHGRYTYDGEGVVWGARHLDILSEVAPNTFELDVRKFDAVVPTAPTSDFPYPKG